MQAKINGAWNLHRLTQNLALDHFVLFSSVAATLGSVGQANYGAANAYLDALAHWRQAQGLPALSINWGPWKHMGMTALLSSAEIARTHRRGMRDLESQQALQALGELLTYKGPQATVLDMDWKTFARSQQDRAIAPFFSDVAQPVPPSKSTATVQTHSSDRMSSDLITQLREAPLNHRRRLLLNNIREQASMVMGLPISFLSNPRQPLNTIGLDSLMAVELRNALGKIIGQSLPATLIFDYPTLDVLTDFLLNDLLKLGETPEEVMDSKSMPTIGPATSPITGPTTANDLEALSDEEAEELLLAELMKPKKQR
jgi:myxalamid-type polyketide synthase MxaB